METETVSINIESNIEKVWENWTLPRHVIQWNFPNPDWQCKEVENDLKKDGAFVYQMEKKDGTNAFDYCGTYSEIIPKSKIALTLDDGRSVIIRFEELEDSVALSRTWEVGDTSDFERVDIDWQGVLANFKGYVRAGQQ